MIRPGPPSTLFVFFLLTAILGISQARASGQNDLDDAVNDLNRARGPEAYTALRAIWQAWGTTDPTSVERALESASQARHLPVTVREYAEFLDAHARTRRGDATGARNRIAELGFADEWIVVGPFDNEGKTGLDTEYGPEAQFEEAFMEGQTFSGKERPVRWRETPDVFHFGWLNGASLFRPEQNICFYASTFASNESQRTIAAEVFVGAEGAFRFFVNGVRVLEDTDYRGHDVDRRGVALDLPPGKSNLMLKVCGQDEAPIASLRIVPTRRDETPIALSASLRDAQDALPNRGKATVRTKGLGSLDQFEQVLAGGEPDAADLEQFARYLVLTHGDDPSTHAARDAARNAAERSPTIPRLLLAGELSEDYNTHRVWVDKAEALARARGIESSGVALARASVEQGGLNWRDAFPHYQVALRRDPESVSAILGRVSLFNEANMHRTALTLLEQAVAANPKSVTLLNLYASQLRHLGQTAEADEVEERYAQFRFDDHNYLSKKINLALARGNRAAAEHWIDRLLEFNPDSLWAYSTAASAFQRLAQPERASAMYRRALQLAPEDVQILQALSNLKATEGDRTEQVRLLRQILELRPQAKEIQEYVEHIEPETPKKDEAYAWEPDKFLKDRNAPADGQNERTLLDLTVTTVFENGLSSQFRQVVFQPLVDSAAALNQQYSFAYQADGQRVQLRGARVFRTDGSVDEAFETGISEANDPSIAMYTSSRVLTVHFPRLDAGDVVELRYRVDDIAARNEFNDYFGDIHYLQSDEVVGHAEYVLITPKKRRFYIDHRGIDNLRTSEAVDGQERIFRFWAKQVPAIEPEPSMPPWPEVAGFVHVSTYANYQELGKWYWGLVQDQFDLDEETRKLAHQIADPLPTEREKVAAIYNWVIKNTRYVALEFGIYGFKPRRCVQTVSRGWGDCKDKATVIVSLLKELGIDSTIVVVRTQMKGSFHSDVASLAPFDHAIAYVPSLDLYLDGTAEYTGITELPSMDQEALGILVHRGNAKLVTLPKTKTAENLHTRTLRARLAADGKARVELDYTVRGPDAPGWRRRYSAGSSRRERVLADLSQEFPGIQLEPNEVGLKAELDDFEQPVKLEVRGTVPAFARREGDRLSLPVTTRTRLSDKYASLSNRSLAVHIGPFGTVEDRIEVELPPGMKVEAAPSNVSTKTRFGSYSVAVKQESQRVVVESRIAVDVTRIEPKDYAAWRAFCQAADLAMTPRLVVSQ